MVTRCNHYFCDGCAITNYTSDGNCFVCGEATNGVFNVARDLIKKLKKLKDKAERGSLEE